MNNIVVCAPNILENLIILLGTQNGRTTKFIIFILYFTLQPLEYHNNSKYKIHKIISLECKWTLFVR